MVPQMASPSESAQILDAMVAAAKEMKGQEEVARTDQRNAMGTSKPPKAAKEMKGQEEVARTDQRNAMGTSKPPKSD